MIELKEIYKTYGKKDNSVEALKNITIHINKGELVCITGPSGSGKSTLLNLLGCLDIPTKGEYFLDGINIYSNNKKEMGKLRNKKFGFIVQDFGLISDYTVKQNVEIPLVYAKIYKKNRKIEAILEKFKILDKKNSIVTDLSGGQKQRVAIARALINDPDIILADEPTGSLDQKTGKLVIDILLDLHNQGKTVIIITHDTNIAKRCERIIRIEDGIIAES